MELQIPPSQDRTLHYTHKGNNKNKIIKIDKDHVVTYNSLILNLAKLESIDENELTLKNIYKRVFQERFGKVMV